MSFQAGHIINIDVGTPPPTAHKYKEWRMVSISFHEFEGLPSERHVPVNSPAFTSFGHKWRLNLYPGGRSTSNEGMVGVYLQNLDNKSITIHFGVSVKSKDGRGLKDFASISDGTEFGPHGTPDSNGWPNFWKRSDMINALIDGTLIIEVRMKSATDTCAATPFIPENPIAKSVLAMFNDEESADVVFEVEDEPVRSNETCKRSKTTTTLYGHKFIMEKCASNVLGELCKSENGENGATAVTTVSITDVEPDIFKHILCYVYGGKLSDEEMKENAKDIIDAADKYGVVGLKLEAEASLVTNNTITFENAIDNLLYADSKNCALLKEAVMDFIAQNREESPKKLSFDNLPGSAMKDLLTAVNRREPLKTSTDADDFSIMRVNVLRKMLHEKGLDVDGSREMLITRLEESSA